MAVSDEARRAYELHKPTAEAARSDWTTWLRINAPSGLSLNRLRQIYQQQRRWARRGALRREVELIEGIRPFVDDFENDMAWAVDHPRREFRTRPWRPCDGEPVLHTVPSVTVIHLFSGEALVGIPYSYLERIGVHGCLPRDEDLYGLLMFMAQRASDNWRYKLPEGTA